MSSQVNGQPVNVTHGTHDCQDSPGRSVRLSWNSRGDSSPQKSPSCQEGGGPGGGCLAPRAAHDTLDTPDKAPGGSLGTFLRWYAQSVCPG